MNFLADGQTTKKWKIIPITKSLFFGESCSSSVVVACGRGPFLFEKKMMEFHFGWWTFYRDSHSGGVVALGVEVGVEVGWVEGWFWEVDVQEAATILAQDLGSSISTSDSVSLPPALYPVSESLHSLSRLHSEADLSLSWQALSAAADVASSQIFGRVGRSLSVGRRCRNVRLLSFHTRRCLWGTWPSAL